MKTAIIATSLLLLASCSGKNERYKYHDEPPTYGNSSEEPIDPDPYPTPVPPKVTKKSKPTATRIESDLTGVSISEGVAGEGYHRDGWTHTIEYGQVSDFQVIKEIINDNDYYVVESRFKLKPVGNYHYDAVVKISYVNDPTEGWVIDNVNSLRLDLVSNGMYDDCITAHLDDDGWGGVLSLYLSNNGNKSLVVGGRIYANGKWKKFSQIIEAHCKSSVGGTFGGGNVSDYRIDFVINSD